VTTWTAPSTAADITPELVRIVADVLEGWYPEGPVDWPDVWDRADGAVLDDGTTLDLGCDMRSAALTELRKQAKALRGN
jgi:hypothetical protein